MAGHVICEINQSLIFPQIETSLSDKLDLYDWILAYATQSFDNRRQQNQYGSDA
jgi:hypothetical protein